ncbi:isochorismatase family protein [Nocardiopsis lambiniae]|uniref:Isochorismatase family protein n=1 Tax=Nocardiopsis lambiniae TaxID=3075539 RepID=A0ABU2M9T8_9ACTN|nr:isochorismatase family protein [Nocardiopsis sp. DSM 44743]MDT0329433.1 isochorismatase family protein [Nocardiopsis sp. DSM 44743]
MSLPLIPAYPMPTESDLPENRMEWAVDPDRCVLLVHDMQRYFVNALPPEREPTTDLLVNIALLRETCVQAGVPRVFTAQPGAQEPRDRGLLRDLWGEGLRDDPEHTDIVAPFDPRAGDLRVTKWRYSAFARTDLEARIRALGRDQLIVCGVYAHIGVLMTACDAFMRDVETFVVADAVADFSAADHTMALSYAARRCASVVTTKRVLAALPDRE